MAEALRRYAGMSVLVVDDDASNVALFKALIEGEGLPRVATETDPQRVPQRLVEQHPDLVVLDLHMPHVDGYAVLAQIRAFAAGSYLPVLVLTADTTASARNRALREGAQDFLTKPVDIVEAVLRMANLLETRLLYQTLRREVGVADPTAVTAGRGTRVRIEKVLLDRAIRPVYQPVFDIATMATVGYEGLSRFSNPAPAAPVPGGPDRWFADAFAVGLGIELEWLAAKMQMPFLDACPPPTFLAVNMSPATILHITDNKLCGPTVCPRIVIELTEHVPIQDYSAVHRALAEMRGHGARLAADDLGSGYAGFRHLIALQPDIIKLDISLVAGIHRSHPQRALAAALVTFANDIGATVIGEGVEHAAELEVLRGIGVRWAQGYHLGRPAPTASAFPAWA